jgi:hypothetical protein
MNAQAVAVTKYERAPTFKVCGIQLSGPKPAAGLTSGVARRAGCDRRLHNFQPHSMTEHTSSECPAPIAPVL